MHATSKVEYEGTLKKVFVILCTDSAEQTRLGGEGTVEETLATDLEECEGGVNSDGQFQDKVNNFLLEL